MLHRTWLPMLCQEGFLALIRWVDIESHDYTLFCCECSAVSLEWHLALFDSATVRRLRYLGARGECVMQRFAAIVCLDGVDDVELRPRRNWRRPWASIVLQDRR